MKKMITDILMTAALLLLMTYQVTGERFHEWIGVLMFLLSVIHNILNIRWHGSLFKGKYSPLRAVRTLINFAVLSAMLCLAYSGIILSRDVREKCRIGSFSVCGNGGVVGFCGLLYGERNGKLFCGQREAEGEKR